MTQSLSDVFGHQHVGEALHLLPVHHMFERLFGRKGDSGVELEVALQDGRDESQSLSGLQLRSDCQKFVLFDVKSVAVEFDEHEQLGTPVLRVGRTFLQTQQREAGGRQGQTANAISPLLLSASVLDVLVDEGGQSHCAQGVEPGGQEHDEQTQEDAGHGNGPVEVLEARSPRRGAQQRLDGAGQVEKHVAHEEKHC